MHEGGPRGAFTVTALLEKEHKHSIHHAGCAPELLNRRETVI